MTDTTSMTRMLGFSETVLVKNSERTLYGAVMAMRQLLLEALETDGAHHKQWFIEEVLANIGDTRDALEERGFEWKRGIAP